MREQIVAASDLTPARLTQILSERGLITTGTVATVERRQMIEASSACFASLRLTYTARGASDLPTAMFLKTYKPHVRREYGASEVAFYTCFAPAGARLPIVRCYDAFSDPDGNACYCLFEDVSATHASAPFNAAPSLQHVRLAIAVLAQVHAAFWQHDLILGARLDRAIAQIATDFFLYRRYYAELLARYATALPQRWCDVFIRYLLHAPKLLATRLERCAALTLWHSDTHLSNFMYAQDHAVPVYLIDFATYRPGWGLRDVAYTLMYTLEPAQRRTIERELVRFYHTQLVQAGVADYSWGDCWQDYKLGVVANLHKPLINRRSAYAWERVERSMAAFFDLECDEFLLA
jgi:hypothetical protein